MDRLIAAAAWKDAQSLEQAILVASHQANNIDWKALESWVLREGIAADKEVREFYKKIARNLP